VFRSYFVSKLAFLSWLRSRGKVKPARKRPGRVRPGFEILEDRLAPASFAEGGGIITISLTAKNETLTISSAGANNYDLSTNAPNVFGGTLTAPSAFSGLGGSSGALTVNPADTAIDIVDGGFKGGHIIFNNSGINPYSENFSINLTTAGAGNIDFNGTSTFNENLTASTTAGSVNVNAGATLNLDLGTNILQNTAAGGAVNFNGTVVTSPSAAALQVNAFKNITEGAAGVIRTSTSTTATFQLTGGAGTINLDGGLNDFADSVTITQSGGGSVTTLDYRNTDANAVLPTLTGLAALANYTLVLDNTSIVLANGANLPVGINFNYTTGGNITQSAALTFGTATFTVLGDNSILLSIAGGNSITTVGFNATKGDNTTQVSYTGSAGVTLGASNLGLGTFDVSVLNGNITDAGAVVEEIGAAGSTFTVAGTGNTVTLFNAGNDFEGPITITGPVAGVNLINNSLLPQFPAFPVSVTSLTLTYPNAPVNLPTLSLTTLLNVTAQGIFQQAGTIVTASGNASFNAGSNPVLLGGANSFLGSIQVSNSGPNQVVTNAAGSLNFGVGTSFLGNGTLTVTAVGNITQANPIVQAVNAGQTSFTAGSGSSITLNAANAFRGIVDLHTSGAGGSAALTNNTALNMGTSSIGANLTLTGAGGGLSQDPGTTLTVGRTTTIADGGGTVTLDNNNNVFTNSVFLTAGNATVRDSVGPLDFGTSNVPGTLTAHAGGTISQSGGALTVGTSLFDAGTAAITLTNAANAFAGPISTTSTGSAAVQLTGSGTLQLGQLNLGTGALTVSATGKITQAGGAGNGITQVAPGGTITITTGNSVSLNNPNNDWLVPLNLSTGAAGLTLDNIGSIAFVGTPAITGTVNLTAGQTITIPNTPYSWNRFTTSAKQTIVANNITTTAGAITFFGTAGLGVAATLLTLTSSSTINFNGNVNVNTTTDGLALAAGSSVNLNQGVWSQGSSPLTVSGGGVAFNIGDGVDPATFNMIGGTITMTGAGNVQVNAFATFEVGDTTNVGVANTVTLNNGAGSLSFGVDSTLSVGLNQGGLATPNDLLVDQAGSVSIDPTARLTAYSGRGDLTTATPVLSAPAGTISGFFALTVDPANNNAPHAFLMGTDIVVPAYTATQLTIVEGGTVSATGTVTGVEPDSDTYTITASTGGTAHLTTAQDVNGLLDVVVRNATTAVTLTITSTKNLGDGLTALGGIAVDGPGAVTISAPNSDIDDQGVNPFGDIVVQGQLTALTMHDFNGSLNFQDFIHAGGTNAETSTITGRIFDSVSISVPTVLKTLTLAQYTNTAGIDTVTAERFGSITTTGIANTLVPGDFSVSRLTNLNTANSSLAGLGTVSIADQLTGQFDIQKAVTSVTAKLANSFALGLPGGANNPNGDLLGNVTTLNLGTATNTNIESIGNVAAVTATSWSTGNLRAVSFGTITTTGNSAVGDFGDFSSITLTATGNSLGEALGSLTVAGDSASDTFNFVNGNVGTITVGRQLSSWTVTAAVTPAGGAIKTITAGAIQNINIDAKILGTLSAVGNASAGLFGDIVGTPTNVITIQGTPNFAGVALGAITATRNLQGNIVQVENGSLTTVSAGRSIDSSSFVVLSGTVGTVSAAEWIHLGAGNDILVARSIGSVSITGAALATPSSAPVIGDMQRVDILAYGNTGPTMSIGTLSVAGNLVLANNGYIRADNGIGTFKVGRDVTANAAGTTNLISVRNPNTGTIGSLTIGRWNDATASVDLVADTIGTMKVTGYLIPADPSPSKVNGDFLAGNFVLLNTTKTDITSLTVANNMSIASLLAPGGIGALTVANAVTGGLIDADNATGTLGTIGTFQAGQIDTGTVLRAVTFGTFKTAINVPLGADGGITNTTVTATSATAAAGIATVSIASFVQGATFDVPSSITTFTVGEIIGSSQIGAGYAATSSIKTFTAGALASTVLTARSIGSFNVIGKLPTVANASVLTANVSSSVVTLIGNIKGVGLGTATIKGEIIGSDFLVAGGNVTSFSVGGMYGSALLVGAHPAAVGNIAATTSAANWDAPVPGVTFKLGGFKTTGLFDSADAPDTATFRDSFVIAQQLGTVNINGLDDAVPAGSPDIAFGVGIRTSTGGSPGITVNPPGGTQTPGFVVGAFDYVALAG